MKKLLAISLFVILVLSALGTSISALDANALQSYGQIHFNIYSTNTPPKQDGVINPGEYGDPIVVVNYGSPGSAWYDAGGLDDPIMDLAVVPDILPKDLTLYLTYDDNNLYVGVEYWDGNHCTPDELTGVWDGDYVEFDIATNVSGSFDDAADKLRLAMGISDAGNQWMYSAANQSNALEQFPLNSSTESLPIGKIVRNESTKMTTYEVAIPWSYITSNGKVPANAFIYYQTGVGDHRYIENSPYVAYLGTFRWAVDARLIDDIPANAVPHLGTFAGEAPPPVIEEVVEEVEAPADVGTPAVTPPSGGAAQTSDMFALLGLIAIISMAGVVVIKKRVK